MPGVSELNVPLQVSGLIPPGKSVGTRYARPLKNTFPASPEEATVVAQVVPSKVVVAGLQLGQKVSLASGTLNVYGVAPAVNLIVELVKWTFVVWVEPSPETLTTAVNQM